MLTGPIFSLKAKRGGKIEGEWRIVAGCPSQHDEIYLGKHMTKTELIEVVSQRLTIPKSRTSAILEALLEVMKESLHENTRVELRGFGSFAPKDQQPKKARNPSTGEPLKVGKKRSVQFKVGKDLRSRVDYK